MYQKKTKNCLFSPYSINTACKEDCTRFAQAIFSWVERCPSEVGVQQESHRWRSMWQGWVMALQQAQRSVIARAAREARAGVKDKASKSDASLLSLFWAKHAQLRTFFPSDVMTIITFSLPIPMKYNLTNALREMAKTMNIVTNSLAVKLCSAPQSIMLLKPLSTRRIVKAEDISDEICNVM
ncbi:unnamed protein product [Brugia pahangi]|uniref:ACT domain-containing protein n=1 Tax=Brugia pahangi TaxID=6280 RepID=A0A0N4T5M1_BRUPA|nr:unnamed protein product [Brugia pahangi]